MSAPSAGRGAVTVGSASKQRPLLRANMAHALNTHRERPSGERGRGGEGGANGQVMLVVF